MTSEVSRRDLLRALTLSMAAPLGTASAPFNLAKPLPSALQQAAEAPEGSYTPRFFSVYQYKMVQALCEAIIPPDEHSGGAIEAGAPEFIDLLASENQDYQVKLGGGLMWLDGICKDRYRRPYLDCSRDEQKEILDVLAYRANAKKDPRISQGVEFFSFLRDLTVDGFYTSEIGVKDLKYVGNGYLTEFPGCPMPKT
jgi:gluconate 2-dehydrogenase gamma chain